MSVWNNPNSLTSFSALIFHAHVPQNDQSLALVRCVEYFHTSFGQGGKLEIGAPTGKWQMIVVYRGKHCPVSKNYLASLQQIIYELDELGVEVVAVSGDGRERAEAFVSYPTDGRSSQGADQQTTENKAILSTCVLELGFKWDFIGNYGCPGTCTLS